MGFSGQRNDCPRNSYGRYVHCTPVKIRNTMQTEAHCKLWISMPEQVATPVQHASLGELGCWCGRTGPVRTMSAPVFLKGL